MRTLVKVVIMICPNNVEDVGICCVPKCVCLGGGGGRKIV